MASLGEWQYALAWVACLPLGPILATFLSPWTAWLMVIVILGSTAHTIAIARKSTAPFRVLHWMPWAILVANVMAALGLRAFVVEAFKAPSSSMYPTLHIGDHVFVDKLTKLWRSWQRGDVVVFVYPCDANRDYIKRIIGLPGDTIEVRCDVVYVNGKAIESQAVPGKCAYEDYDEMEDRWYERTCSRFHESFDGRDWDVFQSEQPVDRSAGGVRDFPRRDHRTSPGCDDSSDAYAPHANGQQIFGKLVETKREGEVAACDPQYHYVVPEDHVFTLGDNRYNSNDSRIWGSVPIANIKGRARSIWWSSHESGRVGSIR